MKVTVKPNKKCNDESNLESLKKEMDVDFHTASLDTLIARFNTDLQTGLTNQQVDVNKARFGTNMLTPPKKTPAIIKFLKNMFSFFSLLLFFGAKLCFLAYLLEWIKDRDSAMDNLYLGIVLDSVVFITGVFSYYQENKSSKIMDSFKRLIPQESLVLRDGKKVNLKAHEIVVGDIVFIRGGDLNPADMRVIEGKSFKVDNSSLTGESEPQKRGPENSHDNFIEADNMVFSFTYCVDGNGKCMVVSVGDKTLMGRIAKLTSEIKSGKTPIGIEIAKFIKLITIIAFVIGILFFFLAIFVNKVHIITAIVFLIGIIVANVPEGLLMTVTVALTLCAKKMSKKNCLVKNLESVETLGSTSVICSDKTGTLTQNRMTVSHLWSDNTLDSLETSESSKDIKLKRNTQSSRMLIKISALCNKAEFREDQDPSKSVLVWTTNGDASESALIKFVQLFSGNLNDIRVQNPILFEIPFNSVNKFQITVHDSEDISKLLVLMKGAPERVVDRCKKVLIDDNMRDLDDREIEIFNKAYEEMGGMGERVLGFCYCEILKSEFPLDSTDSDEKKLLSMMNSCIFVGLLSLIDPPRAAVPHAVALCRMAGIKVIMVTGDHPITAKAIAKNVGIITQEAEDYTEFKRRLLEQKGYSASLPFCYAAVVTGNDLKEMQASDIDEVIRHHREIVFARTSPQQKLLIVEGFQRAGLIVAVTGDGVNDSPALRQADIGVAMGIAGSDVAKQAADMILLDDNFASIVTGVREGRIIFDNLKKSIAYTLTSNIPEITPFLLHMLIGIPLPLSTVTILCIDLGTDLVPAISLAYENAEMDIMKRKPRDAKTESLVTRIMINYSYLLVGIYQAVAAIVVYFIIMMDHGFSWSTLLFNKGWNSQDVLFVRDEFNQEWSYTARKDLEFTCQTAYFFTIVIVQIADLMISKTRMMSIFTQGIFRNFILLIGILTEILLALAITYVPAINLILQTRPFHPKYLVPAFVLSFLMWAIDEFRRLHMRRHPGGFIQRETYY